MITFYQIKPIPSGTKINVSNFALTSLKAQARWSLSLVTLILRNIEFSFYIGFPCILSRIFGNSLPCLIEQLNLIYYYRNHPYLPSSGILAFYSSIVQSSKERNCRKFRWAPENSIHAYFYRYQE